MKFELVKKVPIVEENGVSWFYDTGMPSAEVVLNPGVQKFFGRPRLRMRGVAALKRYTKFDYAACEIETSDEPIALEGGTEVPLEVRPSGWLVRMTVGGVAGMRYIDTGAAYSYVHNLGAEHPSAGTIEENDFGGRPYDVPVYRVPCEFAGHPFEILCGDAKSNRADVPGEGVIGFDFFNAFTVVVDRFGGRMIFKPRR